MTAPAAAGGTGAAAGTGERGQRAAQAGPLTADDMFRAKPGPGTYLVACQVLGGPRPPAWPWRTPPRASPSRGCLAVSAPGAVAGAGRRIVAAKGLDGSVGSLLRLRLGTDALKRELAAGTSPWVAVAAQDDDAATVTAYDSRGRAHTLDAAKAPQQVVYVIDLDVSRSVAAGLDLLEKELAKNGLTSYWVQQL